MLSLTHVSRQFERAPFPVIDALSLQVAAGSSISIRGASGCGKSTLLTLIAGLDAPDSGEIIVGNANLTHLKASDLDDFRKNQLGMIYQQFNLLDCFNVWDNIAFTARLKGNYVSARQQALMHMMGIDHLADAPLGQLSGGEQQRVAICRALNHEPALVLADEPTGNLDEMTSDKVAKGLFDVCQKTNTTLIVVTHSADVACLADASYRLHNGKLHQVQPNGHQ
ncbi:ABC transporter ATP-binding protein [Alteromonas sp. H39]|uniref:ABC transporter ATP-binding protein n=1 Tax=Alteromonas sp. H39 TaxID=3389876 RepID=UPI0039E1AD68